MSKCMVGLVGGMVTPKDNFKDLFYVPCPYDDCDLGLYVTNFQQQ